MLTTLALTAALAVATQAPYTDVAIYSDRIEFVEFDGETLTREALYFPLALVDENDPPTPLDECVASATVVCGVHGVKWLRYSSGPNGTSCEFECKDTGTGTGG